MSTSVLITKGFDQAPWKKLNLQKVLLKTPWSSVLMRVVEESNCLLELGDKDHAVVRTKSKGPEGTTPPGQPCASIESH